MNLADPACRTSDVWMRLMLICSSGWLAVDTVSMFILDVVLRWRKVTPLVFVHHFVCVVALLFSLITGLGTWYQNCILFAELGVVPVNIVRIMKASGLQHHFLYTPLKLLSLAVWIFSRILFIPPLVWRFRSANYCIEEWGAVVSGLALFSFTSIWLMNLFWVVMMGPNALKLTALDEAGTANKSS